MLCCRRLSTLQELVHKPQFPVTVWRQLLFPVALTHDNCYRADGRCLTKMLPVQDGQNGRQIEGATERGKQTRTDSEFGRAIRKKHAEREAADLGRVHQGHRLPSKTCDPGTQPHGTGFSGRVGTSTAKQGVQRSGPGSLDCVVGGRRPDLCEAPQGDCAGAVGSDGAPWPHTFGPGDSIKDPCHQRCDNGSSLAAYSRTKYTRPT